MKIKTKLFKSTFPREQVGWRMVLLQVPRTCGARVTVVQSRVGQTEQSRRLPAGEVWCRIRVSQSLGGSNRWSWGLSRCWEGGEGAVTAGTVHRWEEAGVRLIRLASQGLNSNQGFLHFICLQGCGFPQSCTG